MYRHLIVPTDGSDVGTRAVEEGLELARCIRAKLTIVTVLHHFHPLDFSPDTIVEAMDPHQAEIDRHVKSDNMLERKVRASGVACSHIRVRHDHLCEAVRMAAKAQDCDLIVMPAHVRNGWLSGGIDAETAGLLSKSTVPVLVLH